MRFAIIGSGAIARMHSSSINELEDAELDAVVDVDKNRAREFAEQYGCKNYYDDYREMLKKSNADIVSVCTPSGMRESIVLDCARAGKNIIVEKPVEIKLDRIDRMIAACRENGVKLTCIYNTRYKEAHSFIKKAISSGRTGRLINGNAYIRWYRPDEYYSSSKWRGTWELDGGGALMNQGIHTVDLLQWYMGDVESVFAYTGTLLHKSIEVEDTAVAALKFSNGAIGTVMAATSIYPGFPTKLEITGETGTIEVSEGNIEVWNFKNSAEMDSEVHAYMHGTVEGNRASDPMAFSNDCHKKQIAGFIDAVKNNTEPEINGEEARKAVQIILAIYESARTGKEIKL